MAAPSATDVIARLELRRTPRRTLSRDFSRCPDRCERTRAVHAIYFLLARGERRTGIASMRWRSGIITRAIP